MQLGTRMVLDAWLDGATAPQQTKLDREHVEKTEVQRTRDAKMGTKNATIIETDHIN